MPSITAVADQLVAADLPVIFLDTCILLDIIRAIKRRYKNCISAAKELHAAATTPPPRCSMVVSHIVRKEWVDHEKELLDEVTRHLIEIEDQSKHFHDACDIFGIVPGFARANYAGHSMGERLCELSRQLLNCGIEVESDNECSGRAMERVIHGIPPSSKGHEAKDCTILEEYLAVCRCLHAAGFGKKKVFCTSNTTDFCEIGGKGPHSKLAPDFTAVSLRFTADLPWGFHDVLH